MIGVDEMEDIRKRARGGESIASIARAVGASEPTVGKRAGMEVWFTPSLGGKSLQAVSVDLVIDEVDDVAPDMVSAEELVAKFYEPALGTHWEHGTSTWSPSSLIWAAAEKNDTLEPNDSISHSTKTQGR